MFCLITYSSKLQLRIEEFGTERMEESVEELKRYWETSSTSIFLAEFVLFSGFARKSPPRAKAETRCGIRSNGSGTIVANPKRSNFTPRKIQAAGSECSLMLMGEEELVGLVRRRQEERLSKMWGGGEPEEEDGIEEEEEAAVAAAAKMRPRDQEDVAGLMDTTVSTTTVKKLKKQR